METSSVKTDLPNKKFYDLGTIWESHLLPVVNTEDMQVILRNLFEDTVVGQILPEWSKYFDQKKSRFWYSDNQFVNTILSHDAPWNDYPLCCFSLTQDPNYYVDEKGDISGSVCQISAHPTDDEKSPDLIHGHRWSRNTSWYNGSGEEERNNLDSANIDCQELNKVFNAATSPTKKEWWCWLHECTILNGYFLLQLLRKAFPESAFYRAYTDKHTWVVDGSGNNYDLYWPSIGIPDLTNASLDFRGGRATPLPISISESPQPIGSFLTSSKSPRNM